jgi:hypothetical protein
MVMVLPLGSKKQNVSRIETVGPSENTRHECAHLAKVKKSFTFSGSYPDRALEVNLHCVTRPLPWSLQVLLS